MTKQLQFTVLHPFCGAGGSALGTAKSTARFAGFEGRFTNLGGIDNDEDACKDFEHLTGVPALCTDMHTLTPAELRRYVGDRTPDFVMASPPCKGFSALLGATRAAEPKYQLMNTLLIDMLFLMLSTWERPPGLIFIENVPRIASRGKHVLDQMRQTAQAEGYTIGEGTHDCGQIGNLGQHRRRWFAVLRHRATVPRFVYHVRKRAVRSCGDVIGSLPMPGDVEAGGPLHAVPNLSWKNWVRLSLIPAGGDWRDLPGVLKEGQPRREMFRRAPLQAWDVPSATVAGPGGSNIGAVSDPRVETWGRGRLGVTGFDQAAGAVCGESLPNNGRFAVADPRRIFVKTDKRIRADAAAILGRNLPPTKATNWQQVAGVTRWEDPGPTVSGGAKIHAGAFQVSDPRYGLTCTPRAGAYRVMRWQDAAQTITGSLSIDNGAAAVADPRKPPPFTPIIVSDDGCWHRPFTTFELAMLQSFPQMVRGKPLTLTGTSHTRARLVIGNAVPPDAAEAVGDQIIMALVAAKAGVPTLVTGPVWAAPEHDGVESTVVV